MQSTRFLILFPLFFLVSFTSILGAEEYYLQVRSSQIRKEPQYWARGLGTVQYGQSINVLSGAKDGWVKVSSGKSGEGFLPLSALSTKKLSSSDEAKRGAPSNSYSASQDEVVVAGKGLNAEVEKSLAKDAAKMNYAAVNRVERFSVKGSELAQFALDGKLGGARS